ncbi:MAG TPA: hypothetical protein ENN07_08465 [candidate division Zixibacteria bacterium]|nr:hypothetical protein [candidate division Zixibacteria bacterium]
MKIRQAIIIPLVVIAPIILAWKSIVTVHAGREHNLTIGMEEGATDGFDIDIDKPAPPPPPIGFYCFFSLSDTNYAFIDGLWGDIRPHSDSASWELVTRNQEQPAKISVSELPPDGELFIDDIRIDSAGAVIELPAKDEPISIIYRKTEAEEPANSE